MALPDVEVTCHGFVQGGAVGHACSAHQTGLVPDFSSPALLPGGLLAFLIAACTPAAGGVLAVDPKPPTISRCAPSVFGGAATTMAAAGCAAAAMSFSQASRVGRSDPGDESSSVTEVPRLTVPEPTVLALIAIGLLGIARAMRRRTNCRRINRPHPMISAKDAANRRLRYDRPRLGPAAHRGDEG